MTGPGEQSVTASQISRDLTQQQGEDADAT